MLRDHQLKRISYGVYVAPDYKGPRFDVIENPVSPMAWLNGAPLPFATNEFDDVDTLTRVMRELAARKTFPEPLRRELNAMADVLEGMIP
jgi:hypothetical protein